jgi:gas vesicle protein
MASNNSFGSFVQGFVIGGVIGVATALLMAPQSGEETRTMIQDKGIELKEKAEGAYADMHKKAEAAFADLRGKVDELSAKIDQAVGRVKQEDSQETTELPEQVALSTEPAQEKPGAQTTNL